jgi:hypothetical protein
VTTILKKHGYVGPLAQESEIGQERKTQERPHQTQICSVNMVVVRLMMASQVPYLVHERGKQCEVSFSLATYFSDRTVTFERFT